MPIRRRGALRVRARRRRVLASCDGVTRSGRKGVMPVLQVSLVASCEYRKATSKWSCGRECPTLAASRAEQLREKPPAHVEVASTRSRRRCRGRGVGAVIGAPPDGIMTAARRPSHGRCALGVLGVVHGQSAERVVEVNRAVRPGFAGSRPPIRPEPACSEDDHRRHEHRRELGPPPRALPPNGTGRQVPRADAASFRC